ncbi:dihydroneopterin aldolase [Phaeobacter sp.]|uniref:dihydroneopterin aldolase n=1 Tax=Phaeobacter sp. TaxID=1902409 RepID=UPI0025E38028|nr:dihydroneopterin aldolase [Phaeobacter sp.]
MSLFQDQLSTQKGIGSVELRDLEIAPQIGTYGSGDVVPETHILDLSLRIDTDLVLIDADQMDRVFDYDLLVRDIDAMCKDRAYETQEFLITRIVQTCAALPEVEALSIFLRKRPELGGSGQLGIRLDLDEVALRTVRSSQA